MKIRMTMLLGMALALFSTVVIGAPKGMGDNPEAKLVSGIKALSPVIVAVRPASVSEPSREKFKVLWTPAVTLRAKTPLEAQLAIAQKVADFVISFQGGEPTEDVMGGIVAFIEGDGWNPELGQVFYRVEKPSAPAEVWVAVRTTDKAGNTSCCEDAGRIGTIAGARFLPESTAKLVPAIAAIIKAKAQE